MSEGPATRFADDAHRYRLDSRIATGGMGEVWRASDTRLGREVAVKLLKTEYADDETFRTRFSSEAQHAAALHHPGVAAVYDFGEASPPADDGTPRPYLVMELVDGEPLSALITPGRPLDPEVTRDLMAQAADAIGAAHAAGIVHRDVKPANLLITPDRRVKITDFGIARATEGMALTQTGQVMGTPQYLSPEQASGGAATPASDVYSLGVVAFECLSSRRPFVGETPVATALAHLREPVPPLPGDVPADLAAVVTRALAKEPSERYADATAFGAALRDPSAAAAATPATQLMPGGSGPLPPPPATPVTPADPQQRRRAVPWLWIALAVAAVAAVVALIAVALASGGEEQTDPGAGPTRNPGSSATREPTTQEQQPTSEAPPTTSEPTETETEPETIDLDEDDYVGRDRKEVEQELKDLGLKTSPEKLDNDGSHEEDTVESLDPTSDLQEGDTVTVRYWDKAGPVEELTTSDEEGQG